MLMRNLSIFINILLIIFKIKYISYIKRPNTYIDTWTL